MPFKLKRGRGGQHEKRRYRNYGKIGGDNISIAHYTMKWMVGALWLVIAHDLLKYMHTDDVTENLFSLFCPTWRAVLKVFASLFWIKQVNISKSCLKVGKTGKAKQKEFFVTLKCLNWKKSSKKLWSCVTATREPQFESAYAIISKKSALENYWNDLFTRRIKKKTRTQYEL